MNRLGECRTELLAASRVPVHTGGHERSGTEDARLEHSLADLTAEAARAQAALTETQATVDTQARELADSQAAIVQAASKLDAMRAQHRDLAASVSSVGPDRVSPGFSYQSPVRVHI